MSASITVEKVESEVENNHSENVLTNDNAESSENNEFKFEEKEESNNDVQRLLESQRASYSEDSEEPPESILESEEEPTDMTDMTDTTQEIDLQKDTLYQILSSVLEDDDGNNLTETVSKIADSSNKNYENFESIARNLRTISEGITKHNKAMDRIVSLFERFVDLQMDDEPANANAGVNQ